MQQPLQQHIAYLEKKIQHFTARANDLDRTADERYQAAIDLGNAERALDHFRKAYILEQGLSDNIPS